MNDIAQRPAKKRDRLLSFAGGLALAVSIAMVAAIVGLLVGAVAIVALPADIAANVVVDGVAVSGGSVWAIAGMMLLAIVPISLMIWFLRVLRQIIKTVDQGDPFVPDNAGRLAKMGWLALGIQVAVLPVGTLGFWLKQAAANPANDDIVISFSGSGLILVLLLFILARIFRQGAAMREELEGTV